MTFGKMKRKRKTCLDKKINDILKTGEKKSVGD